MVAMFCNTMFLLKRLSVGASVPNFCDSTIGEETCESLPTHPIPCTSDRFWEVQTLRQHKLRPKGYGWMMNDDDGRPEIRTAKVSSRERASSYFGKPCMITLADAFLPPPMFFHFNRNRSGHGQPRFSFTALQALLSNHGIINHLLPRRMLSFSLLTVARLWPMAQC